MTVAIASLAIGIVGQNAPVLLQRTFKAGEKLTYFVNAQLKTEERQFGLQTFLPGEQGYEYEFTTAVTGMKADGICEMTYKRPTMTEVQGEQFDRPEKRTVVKTNWDMKLTVSPINEVLETKDMRPKPAEKPKPGAKPGGKLLWANPLVRTVMLQDIGAFTSEVYRLSLFIGGLDSGMDFAPRLPYDEVQVGEVWKRTVGYSPQRLGEKGSKSAVTRLDYSYVYKGTEQFEGKTVWRIEATMKLDTDIAEFLHQIWELKPDETGLKHFRLRLDAGIKFYLDAKTGRTLFSDANSAGGITVEATTMTDQAAEEVKLKGHTTMRLKSQTP